MAWCCGRVWILICSTTYCVGAAWYLQQRVFIWVCASGGRVSICLPTHFIVCAYKDVKWTQSKETDEKSSIFSNFNCTFQRCFVPFKNRKDLKKKVGFNRVCYLCFHWSARCKGLQRKKGLTFCSIKASPFNISLKGVSFIREAVHSVTVMVLISHTYYSRLRCRLAVIGLWWVVGPNLKTLSICNLLKTLSHGLTQCIEQIKPKRISFVFMSSLYTSRY